MAFLHIFSNLAYKKRSRHCHDAPHDFDTEFSENEYEPRLGIIKFWGCVILWS